MDMELCHTEEKLHEHVLSYRDNMIDPDLLVPNLLVPALRSLTQFYPQLRGLIGPRPLKIARETAGTCDFM